MSDSARELTLKTAGLSRSTVPGLDLTFANPPVRYDSSRDAAIFEGNALGTSVSCMISGEALDDHFEANGLDRKKRVESVLKNRSTIELMARTKYLSWPIEEPGTVLIKTMDVPRLLKELSTATSPPPSRRSRGKLRTKR